MHKHGRNDKYVKIYTWLIYICITTSCSIHNRIVIHQTFGLLYGSPLQWHWETCWEVYTAIMKNYCKWTCEKRNKTDMTAINRTRQNNISLHRLRNVWWGSDRGALYRGLESSVSVDWSGSWLQVFGVVTDMWGFVSTAAASSLAMSCWWFDHCMLSQCRHFCITICQCSFVLFHLKLQY